MLTQHIVRVCNIMNKSFLFSLIIYFNKSNEKGNSLVTFAISFFFIIRKVSRNYEAFSFIVTYRTAGCEFNINSPPLYYFIEFILYFHTLISSGNIACALRVYYRLLLEILWSGEPIKNRYE